MANPLVSIIIPCSRHGGGLSQAIDKALAQTLSEIEVIVVNDGPDDNAEEVARGYGDQIIYISPDKQELASARKVAIERARGKYFYVLDSDDIDDPKTLSRMVEAMEQREAPMVVGESPQSLDGNLNPRESQDSTHLEPIPLLPRDNIECDSLSDSSTPRISVIMPVYNAERYLGLALESILNQTYANFEIIIYDDGSNDRSPAILKQYAAQDKRIRLYFQGHKGYIPWLNEGVQVARGEFIARMDADDISNPKRFEKQIEYLDNHSECSAVGSRVLCIDEDGDPLSKRKIPLSHEEIDKAHLSKGVSGSKICHPTLMIRREAIVSLKGYRECCEYAEDLDLFLRLAETSAKIANLPDVLLRYRMHAQCVGASRRLDQLRSVYLAVKEAYQRRGILPPAGLEQSILSDPPIANMPHWYIYVSTENGNWRTARKHALRILCKRPWSLKAWRLGLRMSLGWFSDQPLQSFF